MQYPGLLYSELIGVDKDTCKKPVHILVTWSLATDIGNMPSECSVDNVQDTHRLQWVDSVASKSLTFFIARPK